MKRIVVTGAAGFIGGHLCRRVKQTLGADIVAVDSLRSGDWMRTPSGLVQLQRDIAEIDFTEWLNILKGVDVLFHLAAEKYNSSKSSPEQLLRTNVLATERLFRAAASSNVKRVVFTSSLYAYGSMGPRKMLETDLPRPRTLYGASKIMGEHLLHAIGKEAGLSWNVARLFFIYGSGQFAEGGKKTVIVKKF
jgi:UDP-glucose 4-epimerase